MTHAVPHDGAAAPPGVVAVLLVDHLPRHRAWAWLQLARGPSALRGTPGLAFAKVMGSGEGGGFGLRPSGTHQGLVCAFDTVAHAQDFLAGARVQAYRERARQWWSGLLAVTSSRGHWDGHTWGAARDSEVPLGAAFATLTRASIRPAKVAAFWRHAPPAQDALLQAPGCELAMGLGEAPLLRQCTFSVWRDEAAMAAYAQAGAHGRAAQAAWRQGFFSESMFVRMRLLASAGQWPPAASLAATQPALPDRAVHG